MKRSLCLALLLTIVLNCFAQKKQDKFAKIDQYARNTAYYPFKELAQKLTAPYKDEASKVRSIFIWITSHIVYDVAQYRNPVRRDNAYIEKQVDSLRVTKDLYWQYVWALQALKDQRAVCAGYAALFKVLCEEACLRAVVINGNGRWPSDVGKISKSNHAWNAVMIGDDWKLLDVTWASGYTNFHTDQFIRKFEERYYCIPPERMILDHYPNIAAWALLPKVKSKAAYDNSAYISSHTDATVIPLQYSPSRGMLMLKRNDTITFELELPGSVEGISVRDNQKNITVWYSQDPDNRKQQNSLKSKVCAAPVGKNRKKDVKPVLHKKVINTTKDRLEQDMQTAISKQMAPAVQTSFLLKGNYYYQEGKTIKFPYIVKGSGLYTLDIFINGHSVLQYTVFAK